MRTGKHKAPNPKDLKPGDVLRSSDGIEHVVQGNKGNELGLRERGTNRYFTIPHRHLVRHNWAYVFDSATDEAINNDAPVKKLANSQEEQGNGTDKPDYGPLFCGD